MENRKSGSQPDATNGHDCQSQKRWLKPSLFRQLTKVFDLLTVSRTIA